MIAAAFAAAACAIVRHDVLITLVISVYGGVAAAGFGVAIDNRRAKRYERKRRVLLAQRYAVTCPSVALVDGSGDTPQG